MMLIKKSISIILVITFAIVAMTAALAMHQEDIAAASKEGPVKKSGKLYFFKKGKPAKASKERRVKHEGKTYYVLKDGRIKKGWNVAGSSLYYFGGKNSAMVKGKKVSGITILPNGKAEVKTKDSKGKTVTSLDASIRLKCIKVLKRRGVFNKSKSEQLRSAWTYLTDRKTFGYEKYYPNLGDSKWTKKYADRMLSRHKGNCYGFACTFAAFAWTIGYDPYVVCGRCRGGRDHASDGFTRHCVTRIGGKWYDPEYWAIYRSHYNYGSGSLNYTLKDRKKPVRFKKVKGTIGSSIKTVSGNLKKIGSEYYYLDSSGNTKKGAYYISKKLYYFSTKGKYGYCMKVSAFAKLKKIAKKGVKYDKLTDIIGKTKKYNDECDEYSSRTYLYENIYVTVRPNKSGDYMIREIGDIEDIQI